VQKGTLTDCIRSGLGNCSLC